MDTAGWNIDGDETAAIFCKTGSVIDGGKNMGKNEKKKQTAGNNLSDTPVSLASLKQAIKSRDREQLIRQLKEGALEETPAEEKIQLCQNVIALRDMRAADQLVKSLGTLTPDMVQIDFRNWKNREFVSKFLEKYKNKFDWKDEQTCEALFETACEVENVEIVGQCIRQKKAIFCYPRLGRESQELFDLISNVKQDDLNSDLIVELFFYAAQTQDGTERLQRLQSMGYDLYETNSDGKRVSDLLSAKIRSGKYPKNKSGEILRGQDKNVLQFLERNAREPEPEEKPKWKKFLPIGIIAAAIILIAAGVFAWQRSRSDTDSDTNTESTGTESTDTDSSAGDTDSDGSYSTDTSLTVENGDTVNIDYTGYVDDVAFDGGSTNGAGADLTIGSGTYIDDFEEQLIGYHVGDTVTVNVTFPEDYGNEELNGKDAVFEVTINGIYE